MPPFFLISVVVTTYNRSDALLLVLDGLAAQSDPNFEVIVADDGSTTEHVDAIVDSGVARALSLTHVWHPDVGFTASRARNRGVAASRGDFILFLDGDCVPEIDFIAQHRKLAQRGFFTNGSRVLLSETFTGRVVRSRKAVFGQSVGYWLWQRALRHTNKLTGLVRLRDGPRRVERGLNWIGIRSCNLGVWRADFERVDGFDESFVGWGHEDADLVVRLTHAGVARKNGYCATEVFHLWHQEAARAQASKNSEIVAERVGTKVQLPTIGYAQQRPNDNAVITRLG